MTGMDELHFQLVHVYLRVVLVAGEQVTSVAAGGASAHASRLDKDDIYHHHCGTGTLRTYSPNPNVVT